MSWGGKQPLLRKSTVLTGSLGHFHVPAKMFYIPKQGKGQWQDGPKWVSKPCKGARELDLSLKPDDVIHNVFQHNDPPPWYDLKAPRYDRRRSNTCGNSKRNSKVKQIEGKYSQKKTIERSVGNVKCAGGSSSTNERYS